jgi:hypothetical protein
VDVGVFVEVEVVVGVLVIVGVGVVVRVGVFVRVAVDVRVPVAVRVGLLVGVDVCVTVGVRVLVSVWVMVGVCVAVLVFVGVLEGTISTGVWVGVKVGVSLRVGVRVMVRVTVGVGVRGFVTGVRLGVGVLLEDWGVTGGPIVGSDVPVGVFVWASKVSIIEPLVMVAWAVAVNSAGPGPDGSVGSWVHVGTGVAVTITCVICPTTSWNRVAMDWSLGLASRSLSSTNPRRITGTRDCCGSMP